LPAGREDALQEAGFRLTDVGPYSRKAGDIHLFSQTADRIEDVGDPCREGWAGPGSP
jgi:hypothetical protein